MRVGGSPSPYRYTPVQSAPPAQKIAPQNQLRVLERYSDAHKHKNEAVSSNGLEKAAAFASWLIGAAKEAIHNYMNPSVAQKTVPQTNITTTPPPEPASAAIAAGYSPENVDLKKQRGKIISDGIAEDRRVEESKKVQPVTAILPAYNDLRKRPRPDANSQPRLDRMG